MSRKLSKLFWCGVFVVVFGAYLVLSNVMSIVTFASLYTSYFAHSSLTSNMTGIYYVLITNGVLLVFEVVLLAAGVYIAKKGMAHEQSPLPSVQQSAIEPASSQVN
jgi:hypothetical protein